MAKAKLDPGAQVVVKNSQRPVTLKEREDGSYAVHDAGGGCEATGTLEDLANHYENVKPAK